MESKYARFIITKPAEEEHGYEEKDGPDVMSAMAYLDGGVLEGGQYCETHWFHKPTKYSPKKHAHDFDECLVFMGGDPENPLELNAELELFIEDERHVITESCIVFIPAGTNHCPMNFLKVDRPVFHLSTGMTTKAYVREQGNADS